MIFTVAASLSLMVGKGTACNALMCCMLILLAVVLFDAFHKVLLMLMQCLIKSSAHILHSVSAYSQAKTGYKSWAPKWWLVQGQTTADVVVVIT